MSSRAFLLLPAAVAFAAGAAWASSSDSHSVDVKLHSATKVAGKTLSPGDYRFAWLGSADKVDVTISRDHKVVARAQAQLKQRPKSEYQEVISKSPQPGTHVLEEVRLGGQTTALVFSAS
jgi:hypothetical protein